MTRININKLNGKNGVYIIAEMSANHNGNIEVALATIRAAKEAGADAIKLQTYTADTISLNSNKPDFAETKRGTIWDGLTAYELYDKAHTPWEWHKDLFDEARRIGIDCFSSPFDKSAVDFLESLNCPAYKIASPEITDLPLISYVASKGKPIIISTGIAERNDIEAAIEMCRSVGNQDIVLLKCTSSYPAPVEEANLSMIQKFKEDFNVLSGLSDHTLGTTVPVVATALGATVIEKHFILDKSIGGPDASFSLDQGEFAHMVKMVRDAEKSLGKTTYLLTEKQLIGRQFARSLYAVKDIEKGDIIDENNVRSLRPGYGLHPKYFPMILGCKVNTRMERGDRVVLEFIDTE